MSLIIQKFGGTSVADTHHLYNVAKKITDLYSKNNDVIVTISAQGDTTDNLLKLASEVSKNPSKREMDALLSSGEQISSSLLAMTIHNLGFPAVSLTGWQAGFKTDSNYGNAEIMEIITDRIKYELDKKNIVIIAGFQGIDKNKNITTLGRGGSDTSAVAIAAAMKADVCKIYTDVDGVYTADPRIVVSAKKLHTISYEEMFELSCYGAQVLNHRSISTAKKYGVKIEVLSSMMDNKQGTIVKDIPERKDNIISGIAVLNNITKITITNTKNKSYFKNHIIPELNKKGINLDESLTVIGKKSDDTFVFALDEADLQDAVNIIEKNISDKNDIQIFYDKNYSKISIINISDNMNINIASLIFETLEEIKINVEMVACTDKRVSVVVKSTEMHIALNSIHTRLFEEDILV